MIENDETKRNGDGKKRKFEKKRKKYFIFLMKDILNSLHTLVLKYIIIKLVSSSQEQWKIVLFLTIFSVKRTTSRVCLQNQESNKRKGNWLQINS